MGDVLLAVLDIGIPLEGTLILAEEWQRNYSETKACIFGLNERTTSFFPAERGPRFGKPIKSQRVPVAQWRIRYRVRIYRSKSVSDWHAFAPQKKQENFLMASSSSRIT